MSVPAIRACGVLAVSHSFLTAEQAKFVVNLSIEDKMLVFLKTALYDGQWDLMVRDLEDRLHGRPFIFKLAHRIQDDLDRIHRLRAFEVANGIDLSTVVPQDEF